MESHEPLNLISLNTRGLGNINKRLRLIGWLNKTHNAETKIIFLQETHSTLKSESQWKKDWGGRKVIFSHGGSNSKGVAIILPNNPNYIINDTKLSPDGRYIALNITIDNSTFCLINCYAPNKPKDQLKWLNQIQEILIANTSNNIIIGGDLNDVFIPALDRYNCKPNVKETEYVNAWKVLCEEMNLTDIWRTMNPDKKSYTWRQGSSVSRLKQSRLDYWLISTHMIYDLEMVDIKPCTSSDHSLIDLDFYKNNTTARGPSFWRFNASLLKDSTYIERIKNCINNSIIKYEEVSDKGLRWDLIKMDIRTSTISYSKFKAKESKDCFKESMQILTTLETQINNNPTDEIIKEYNSKKQNIENYNNEKAIGAQIRSKVNWAEFGEKNSKFFLNLEKRNYKSKCITKLIKNDSEEITNPDDILKYEENFYKTLYSQKENKVDQNIEDTFNDETLPKISDADKNSCETIINLDEIGIALKELKNGKSPGSDGFTTEFYKFFWAQIKQCVLDSLIYAYENGKLSIDQRRGIINLIPKKDKDLRIIKNWRPISLLNTDYKIITKLLANRIKKVLPTVIHPDQVAYLKKRFIGQNIRTIMDTLGYTKLMDKKGIIAFLDFEKAFDTIKWDVIYKALNLFNIGPAFIKWVHTIYNESEACVTNNGYSSPFFKLSRGVRQGCPLSAYLFIVVVELLAHKIRTSNDIKGITIGNTEIKLVQMADDTTVFIEDINSLEHILELLQKFEQYAGLKLNKGKTEAMWIGKNLHHTTTPLGIKWVKNVQSLGIFFSYNTDYVVQKNVMDRAREFKQVLDMWMQRDLSLIGKITILKSLAFSKIIYQCGSLTIPPNFLDYVNDLCYKFVWHNKKDKIRRKTLIAEYERGGLKMLDIYSFIKAQKAMWVKRLMSSDNGSWKALPNLYLQQLLGPNTFKCQMECVTKPANFPGFYWQILKHWFELKTLCTQTPSPLDIRRETLWLNKNIKNGKNELNWKTWQEKNINQIHDIVNAQGTFLTVNELEQKYNMKCNFLQYNLLKDIIPQKWRTILKTMKIDSNVISFNEQIHLYINKVSKCIQNITNKDMYWTFVRSKEEKPIIIDKMEKSFKIMPNQWDKVFTMSTVVKNTKLRTFQYKILYNLIPCNSYLKKITRSDTDKCSTCHKLDDINHYFYNCKNTRIFWNSVTRWWTGATNQQVTLSERDVLIGILDESNKNYALNACIILAKWYIYKCKLNDKQIFIYSFLCDLKHFLNIEKIIALKQGKLIQYNTLWEKIEEHLT